MEETLEELEEKLKIAIEEQMKIGNQKEEKIIRLKIVNQHFYAWPILAVFSSVFVYTISGIISDAIFIFGVAFLAGIAEYTIGKNSCKQLKGEENQAVLLRNYIMETREKMNELRKKKQETKENSPDAEYILLKQKVLLLLWYQLGTYKDNKKIPIDKLKAIYQEVLTKEEIEHSIALTLTHKKGVRNENNYKQDRKSVV